MIAVGSELVDRWGDRFRCTRVQADGDFYLTNLSHPSPTGGKIFTGPGAVAAGWYQLVPASEVAVPPPSASPIPPTPEPLSSTCFVCIGVPCDVWTLCERHVGELVERVLDRTCEDRTAETLGATCPKRTVASVPTIESFTWLPCMTTSPYDDGGPHCYFIKSNLELVFYCEACRPNRNRIVEPSAPLPPPIAPAGPPWGGESPLWETVGPTLAAKTREWYEERAAVLEFEGGLERAAAERTAYRELVARYQASVAERERRRAEGPQLGLI